MVINVDFMNNVPTSAPSSGRKFINSVFLSKLVVSKKHWRGLKLLLTMKPTKRITSQLEQSSGTSLKQSWV